MTTDRRIVKTCLNEDCGISFEVYPSDSNRKYCSRDCTYTSSKHREELSKGQKRVWADPNSRHHSIERNQKLSKSTRESWVNLTSGLNSKDRSLKQSEVRRGSYRGESTRGHLAQGYFVLCNQFSHLLASSDGQVAEHRLVLWGKLGCKTLDCEHECHWGCGRVLTWGGTHGIQADHLDEDRLNNDPENLVPSCLTCNVSRNRVREG